MSAQPCNSGRQKASSPRYRCPECNALFAPKKADQRFCSPQHKLTFNNRLAVVGKPMAALVLAWREARNAKGKTPEAMALRKSGARALAELCRLADAAVAADREGGRMPKLSYVRMLWAAEGTLGPEERT